jgi:hypothetical protein
MGGGVTVTARIRVFLALSYDWTKTADLAARAKVSRHLAHVYLRELRRDQLALRRETGPRDGVHWWRVAADDSWISGAHPSTDRGAP